MVSKRSLLLVMSLALFALAALAPLRASAQPQRRPTPNDTLKSTEVAPDHKVTFRIYAPKADEVSVVRRLRRRQDDQGRKGVWSITVGPLTPDFYSYTFNVDGVRTVDPKNPMIKPGHQQPGQHVPRAGRRGRVRGDARTCPHGEVRTAWYRSGTLDAAEHARLHAAGLRGRHGEVPGPLPAARRRRRGLGLEHDRPRRVHPRQPDGRQEGGADDRGDAQRQPAAPGEPAPFAPGTTPTPRVPGRDGGRSEPVHRRAAQGGRPLRREDTTA